MERSDDFETKRKPLQSMSDDDLHDYFWWLVDKIVAPLVEEARTHTSPSIERSVLLRMGFSSVEVKQLVDQFAARNLLRRGAGHLLLELANSLGISVREAGLLLLDNKHWEYFLT